MRYLDVPFFKQDTNYTCGPVSLQMVLAYHGILESELALREELQSHPVTGTTHQAMITAVTDRGLHCYVNDNATREELVQYLAQEIPVIVRYVEQSTSEDHYSVAVGASDSEIALNDPWNGERVRLTWREFEARWTCDELGTCEQWLMAVAREAFPLGRQYHPDGTE